MLIALPNPDRTFTATLFLPHRGEPSFASVGANAAHAFFAREFADAVPLMPALAARLREPSRRPARHRALPAVELREPHPARRRRRARDRAVPRPRHERRVRGLRRARRAARAIRGPSTATIGPRSSRRSRPQRAPNARAIAEMALENYREMRDDFWSNAAFREVQLARPHLQSVWMATSSPVNSDSFELGDACSVYASRV